MRTRKKTFSRSGRYWVQTADRKTNNLGRYWGYTVHDTVPHYITEEDVEGVGLVKYNTPMKTNGCIGWYKYKHDALKRLELQYPAER